MFAWPLNALASAGQLSSPSLAFPAAFPEASRSNILAALTRPEYKFISGEFVNSSTRLYYAGDTKALNLFLQQIANCPDAILAIAFVKGIDEEPAASWRLSHIALGDAGRLEIQINVDASQIHMADLVIPEIKDAAGGGLPK